jgi:hypothetical protein
MAVTAATAGMAEAKTGSATQPRIAGRMCPAAGIGIDLIKETLI